MKNWIEEAAIRYHQKHQPSRRMEEYVASRHIERVTTDRRLVSALIMSLKIGVGSCLAIGLASLIGLSSPSAAGTITLLTLANTKKGTLSLIGKRFLTFGLTLFLCVELLQFTDDHMVAYMILLSILVLVTELLGWSSTLSVNALIGLHFLDCQHITAAFVCNEFLLLCIGVIIAFVFNLFYAYDSMRLHMFACRRASEASLYEIFESISRFLMQQSDGNDLEARMEKAELEDQAYRKAAAEYADNFYSHAPASYTDYFEMRLRQKVILRAILPDLRMLRRFPDQAAAIARYIDQTAPLVGEIQQPTDQIESIRHLLQDIQTSPQTAIETDTGSLLVYHHALMIMKDIVMMKMEFVHGLSKSQKVLFFRNLEYSASSQPDAASSAVQGKSRNHASLEHLQERLHHVLHTQAEREHSSQEKKKEYPKKDNPENTDPKPDDSSEKSQKTDGNASSGPESEDAS